MKDLSSQQLKLATSDYDLRITNLARFIFSKLPIRTGSLIDVGAGNGLFLKYFKNRGFTVSGIELEKEQVHQMRQDHRLKGVRLQQGDITRMRGEENYDVVIASDVIEHIENDQQALENLFSFVAPGGCLVITVPAHMHLFGKRDRAWGHFRRYDVSMLRSRLSQLKSGTALGFWQWNSIGYFAYYFYEKILQRPIQESFRYKQTPISKVMRMAADALLKVEEFTGGLPIGLTLIAIVAKNEKPQA